MPKTDENTASAHANGVIDLIGGILTKNLITHKSFELQSIRK